jgi:maltooligosyltrehalose trehalohydrolase
VREFYLANVKYWIEEFHFDGYRFDATQNIYDSSDDHILAAITRAARQAAGGRKIYLVSENEPQHTRIVRLPEHGGVGMDALWNDDFHHSALVALTGRNEAYFTDYRGSAQEFISACKWGYLYQGQIYRWQKKRRGTPALDLPPTAFIHFIQNHDQIANFGVGLRAHKLCGPNEVRAITALMLLSPQTPMLFQGQEWAASAPFNFFADHDSKLGELICNGRRKEISQFPSAKDPELLDRMPAPCGDRATFENCKLNWSEIDQPEHQRALALHRDLLKLRREEACFRRVQKRGDIDGAVLGENAFVLRYFGANRDDRLMVINLGVDLELTIAPEPLLAAPYGTKWETMWSSESPAYGGGGVAPLENQGEDWRLPGENWRIPGRSATVLRPAPARPPESDGQV